MPNAILRRGDRGDEVVRLQGCLNRVGAMLAPDGDFGLATDTGVRHAQGLAGQPVTGAADAALWDWLAAKPEPFPLLHTNGVAFIAREETGGLAYYQSHTCWPHFPGAASGITIGVGYDLRFNSEENFRATWADHIAAPVLAELAHDMGRPGTRRRAEELRQRGIEIPFAAAWAVFIEKTLPRFYAETKTIYPSIDGLPGLCSAALVSIVFNRGASLSGDGRREMRQIQSLLAQADEVGLAGAQRKELLSGVESEIVSMKRLWEPTSGVFKRRQAEANLWREGIAAL